MPAGIERQVDRGVVGFAGILGGTWHGFPEYAVIDGPVPIALARQTLDVAPQKWPVVAVRPDGTIPGIQIIDGVPRMVIEELTEEDRTGTENFVGFFAPHALNAGMYCIVSGHDERVLSSNASVGPGYRVFPNDRILDDLDDLLKVPGVEIESCGTLHGLSIGFVNIKLGEFVVQGDISPTVSRIMVANSFDGRAITGCEHDVRIVCMNTLRMAEASGLVNKTLLKRKHTKNGAADVKKHMDGLKAVQDAISTHRAALNWMATMPMNDDEVKGFLAALFPDPEPRKDKKTGEMVVSERSTGEVKARRDAIEARFDGLEDLQAPAIRHTRYAALQAVTNWTSNVGRGTDAKGNEGYDLTKGMPAKAGTDSAEAWYDGVTDGSNRDKLNQQAYSLLTEQTAA